MNSDLVTFDIIINGSPIDSTLQVLSIGIEHYTANGFASVEIILDGVEEGYPLNLSHGFTIGSAIQIKLGYDTKNQTAFDGIITDKGARLSRELGAKSIFLCETDDETTPKTGVQELPIDYIYAIDLSCDIDNIPSGSLQIQGTMQYVAGDTVNLGAVISGFPVGTISSVIHEVNEGNWFTTLVFTPVLS